MPANADHMKTTMTEHLKKFFSNPLVGGIGSVASVLGLAAAVYFFVASQRHRELRCYANPVRTPVVKMGQSSRLAVFHDDQRVATNLTAAQLVVWNAGTESIRRNEILEDALISVPKGKILEANIRSVSRELCNFSASIDDDGQLRLEWEILEKDDGASIQILYTGTPDDDILIKGVIEGQREISPKGIIGPTEVLPGFHQLNTVSLVLTLGVLLAITAFSVARLRLASSEKWILKKPLKWMLAFLWLTLILAFVSNYAARPIAPPISF